MAESKQIVFSYKEVAECLVKRQGLTEGIWGIYIRFGISAANMGPSPSDVRPTAIIPVLEIGLQRLEQESNITVDAAKVNPPSSKGRAGKRSVAKV